MSGDPRREAPEDDVLVWRCLACGWQAFPLRLGCASCGSSRGEAVPVTRGVLAEQTVVRRAIGGPLPEPVRIGTVHADGGAILIARLEGTLAQGDPVTLRSERGAPVARAPARGS